MECPAERGAGRPASDRSRICLLAAGAAACAFAVSSLGTGAAESKPRVFELTIAGGTVPAAQRLIRVTKGDAVQWRIASDAPGELHLHAYRLEARLAAGTPAVMSFNAYATGRFRIEWHPAAAPPASGSQHAPPLAILEVHPK